MFSLNVSNSRLKCHHTPTRGDCSVMSSRISDQQQRKPDRRPIVLRRRRVTTSWRLAEHRCWRVTTDDFSDERWGPIQWSTRYGGGSGSTASYRHRRTIRPSLNWTRSGTSSQCKSSWRRRSKPRSNFRVPIYNTLLQILLLYCIAYNTIQYNTIIKFVTRIWLWGLGSRQAGWGGYTLRVVREVRWVFSRRLKVSNVLTPW